MIDVLLMKPECFFQIKREDFRTLRDTRLRIRIERYKCSEYDSSSNEGEGTQ
jgi:hypothetical protein